MKKIVRLTESDLTRIVKRVIQEEKVNESKIKNLALGLGLSASILLPSCNSGKYSDENVNKQTIIFMKKLNEIDETTPEDLTITFLDMVKTNEIFKEYDSYMINGQISSFYRLNGEKHLKLCAEMIVYQLKKCGEDKKVDIQVEEYVDKLRGGKLDKIDSLILKSFNDAVRSIQKQIEYESQSGYLR